MEIFSKSMLISFIITLNNEFPEMEIAEKLDQYNQAFIKSVEKNQDIKLSFQKESNGSN